MTENLYPKPARKGWTEKRRWRVDYRLSFSGGRVYSFEEWSSYHYWRWAARFSAWRWYHAAEGGAVVLVDQLDRYGKP